MTLLLQPFAISFLKFFVLSWSYSEREKTEGNKEKVNFHSKAQDIFALYKPSQATVPLKRGPA
jgi:hypothetical protein